MKFLHYDDLDPRCVWGNPNLRWGDPSYLLEEGDPGYVVLQPGQPGYIPSAPPKPESPRRRHSPAALNPSTTLMPEPDDSFHYDIGPTSGNRWRPRAVIQGKQDAAEHVAAVVARLAAGGITATPEVVAAAIQGSDEITLLNVKRTLITEYPGGYRRTLPVTRGSQPTQNFEGTFENLSPDGAVYWTAPGRDLIATDFHSDLGVISAEKGAVINHVFNVANGADDQYKVGKINCATGRDLDDMGDAVALARPELAGTGVFYTSVTNGTVVQVPWDSFSPKKPSEIAWIVPAGLTGPQTLTVKVYLNGGVRTTIWQFPLTPAP